MIINKVLDAFDIKLLFYLILLINILATNVENNISL